MYQGFLSESTLHFVRCFFAGQALVALFGGEGCAIWQKAYDNKGISNKS